MTEQKSHTPQPLSALKEEPKKTNPLALVEVDKNTRRLVAVNRPAQQAGLTRGMAVTDAQGICPTLDTRDHDPKADETLLEDLALKALRFTPLVMVEPNLGFRQKFRGAGEAGLALNISGCAHLFGGEEKMAKAVSAYCQKLGLSCRIAIAETLGAARALACYEPSGATIIIPPSEDLTGPVHKLPMAALAVDPDIILSLNSLGLKTIGDLGRAARSSLTRRFGDSLMATYDRMIGQRADAFTPLIPPAQFRERRQCVDPLMSLADLEQAADKLAPPLARQLDKAGQGATALRFLLFRLDGHVYRFDVRLGSPSQDADHFARLLKDRLKKHEDRIDAGFGFDVVILEAADIAPFAPDQLGDGALETSDAITSPAMAALADRLNARFGDKTAQRFSFQASHWPERSSRQVSFDGAAPEADHQNPARPARPLTLFNPPQAIEAMAEVPDAPPKQFRWRKQLFQIARAEGPERIAPEWWLMPDAERNHGAEVKARFRSRDYYWLEDKDGHRFWVFRRGLYGPDLVEDVPMDQPHWFIHGLFG